MRTYTVDCELAFVTASIVSDLAAALSFVASTRSAQNSLAELVASVQSFSSALPPSANAVAFVKV